MLHKGLGVRARPRPPVKHKFLLIVIDWAPRYQQGTRQIKTPVKQTVPPSELSARKHQASQLPEQTPSRGVQKIGVNRRSRVCYRNSSKDCIMVDQSGFPHNAVIPGKPQADRFQGGKHHQSEGRSHPPMHRLPRRRVWLFVFQTVPFLQVFCFVL